MSEFKIVQAITRRDPARFRGALSSEELNTFQDSVVHDITNFSTAINANAQNVKFAMQQAASETVYLKRRLEALEKALDYREHTLGKGRLKIDKYIDFHDTSRFVFSDSISAAKAAPFKGQFGEVYLPEKAVENKFYSFSLRTSEIVVPDDLVIEVTSSFDKLDGNGVQDYEKGGVVREGSPVNAFNGLNESAWVRKVEFPLESSIDEVEVQLTVVVPSGISSEANLIELIPYPEGSVDITSISTSSDLTSSFVELDSFEAENNATARRHHFTSRSVEQVRVRLRCRNWREINGKKVFSYGLQELGLKLVEYTQEFNDSDAFGQNATSIVKIEAPKNHVFQSLFRVDPEPNFLLEDGGKRHVRLRLSSSPDLLSVFWDSDIDGPPQIGIEAGVKMGATDTVYAIYTLKFVASSGGVSSPYLVGTTPYLNGLGIVFEAIPTNANR